MVPVWLKRKSSARGRTQDGGKGCSHSRLAGPIVNLAMPEERVGTFGPFPHYLLLEELPCGGIHEKISPNLHGRFRYDGNND
jgi:hypothetical protein